MTRITMDIEPDVIVAGQRYVGEVIVRTDRQQKCNRVSLTIRIEERWRHASRRPAPDGALAEYTVYRADLSGPTTLPLHETRFPVEFDVPATAPPSHETGPVQVECTATIQVHTSGMFSSDPRRILLVHVRGAPVRTGRGEPVVAGMLPSTVRSDRPRIELGLPGTVFAAGERMPLTVAIFDGGDTRPRELAVSFVPHFRLRRFQDEVTTDAYRVTQRMQLAAAPSGTTVPLQLEIPVTRAPTLDCLAHAIDWSLVVRTGGGMLGDALETAVPIRIVPPGSELPPLGPQPPLSGRDDYATLATLAAASGWQQKGSQASRIEGSMRSTIAFAYRGGFHLVIAVDYLALDIGLRVHDPQRIESTDRPRAAVFLDSALPALRALPDLQLLEWTDTYLACTRPIAALDAATWANAVAAAAQLRHLIATARALIQPALDGGPYRT